MSVDTDTSTSPSASGVGGSGRAAEPRALPAAARVLLVVLRLSLGWVFLWAFLDKTFGLGFATERENAWVEGGSPTTGYLTNVPDGPLAGFYNDLAGQAWVDWLFQIGLLGVGLAFVLGIGMWIGAIAGSLMLVMMWSAVLPPVNNPFMDDHLVYALVLFLLAVLASGRDLGLGRWWESLPFVRRVPILR